MTVILMRMEVDPMIGAIAGDIIGSVYEWHRIKTNGGDEMVGTLMKIDTLQCEEIVIKGSCATTSETGCTRSSSSCDGVHIPTQCGQ